MYYVYTNAQTLFPDVCSCSSDWEKLAKGTLETCHRQYRGRAVAIVKEKAHAYGLTPMEAAVSFNLRSFVAEPACSDYLESVWKGKVSKTWEERKEKKNEKA